jgi:hypothetical protein
MDTPMTQSQALQPCKLCQRLAVLQRSHIISRWAYRRLVNTPARPHDPVQVEDDVAFVSGKQAAQYMLCSDCEALIGRREQYVSTITVDAAGSFPALSQTPPVHVHNAEWKTADASALDCDALAYFASSVIWRAHISDLYPKVTLGSHGAAFADYLLERAPFPKHAMLIIEFVQPATGPRIDRVIVHPESVPDTGFHLHHFAMVGMVFRLLVGRVLPAGLEPFSFVDKQVVMLSNGTQLLSSVASRAKAATPKGRLVRRA